MMDSLYHLVFALVGGFVLVKGLGVRYSFPFLVFLAFLSVLIDLDHVWDLMVLHNLFVLVPPFLLFSLSFLGGFKRVRLYSGVLFVMVGGHLLSDMVMGMGVPLFYPLDDSLYKLPYLFMSPNFVSSFGLSLFLYFGFIALMVLVYRAVGFFRSCFSV